MKRVAAFLIPLILAGCNSTQPTAASGHGGPVQHVESLKRTYRLKDLQRVTLRANGHDIPAWVMDDAGKREEGMMWLEDADVKDDDGMLFAFPDVQKNAAFWMHNTILPLDIIFISPQRRVVNIQAGEAYSDKSLPATGPVQYVLEMKQGSALRLGIKPQMDVTIPTNVRGK